MFKKREEEKDRGVGHGSEVCLFISSAVLASLRFSAFSSSSSCSIMALALEKLRHCNLNDIDRFNNSNSRKSPTLESRGAIAVPVSSD